ncbi:MAG: TetR family transcriptional regulator [Myxococcota bacterium]
MIKTADQPDARGAETRAKLLEAALDCFAERGYAATTRQICDRAGVNLALLSYHFGGKDALWGQVLRVLNDRIAALACAEWSRDLPTSVAAFLRTVVRAMLADPRPMRVMVWARLQPHGFDPALATDAWEPVVRLAVAFLEAQQRAGAIPASVDPGLAIVTFYGLLAEPLIEPAVHRRLFDRDPSDPDHAARIERHLVASGLRLLGLSQEEP